MVVRPEQLANYITESESKAILQAEAILDDALQRASQFSDIENVTASVDLGGGLTRRAAEKLAQKYRQAGWTAKIIFNQKDGDFLQIYYEKRQKNNQWEALDPANWTYY